MTPSSAFVSAICASTIVLQGCSKGPDCTEAFRNGCYAEPPFQSCCKGDCSGGGGSKTCQQTKTHTILEPHKDLTLDVQFSYDISNDDCHSSCSAIQRASWEQFCPDCSDCVVDDPHVKACPDALESITRQQNEFCARSSSWQPLWLTTLNSATSDGNSYDCKAAYRAGCWDKAPFTGCCTSCNKWTGMEVCRWNQTREKLDGEELSLNITFHYDPDDENCKDTCTIINTSRAIYSDFCSGGALVKNGKVKSCQEAMDRIKKEVKSTSGWCDDSSKQIKALTV